MRTGVSKVLVTGGAGFIGSAFVRLAAQKHYKVSLADKLTYSGDKERLREARGKFSFFRGDICNKHSIDFIFLEEKPEAVVHFAAETHVDRSIRDCDSFIKTNILGTQVLLEKARQYKVKKFIHISTDEVYGDIARGHFNEDSVLRPNNPYSATKAAAELLIRSYVRTYNLPAIIVRPCNNYGPWQYPEKLIPLAILKILKNEKVPVYAKGENIREWLYVEDCARGILQILEKGQIGEIYNLGSGEEKSNIDVVRLLLRCFKRSEDCIQFVRDRPGHDIRYGMDSKKVKAQLGFKPSVSFEKGILLTAQWYLGHMAWLFGKYEEVSKFYKVKL